MVNSPAPEFLLRHRRTSPPSPIPRQGSGRAGRSGQPPGAAAGEHYFRIASGCLQIEYLTLQPVAKSTHSVSSQLALEAGNNPLGGSMKHFSRLANVVIVVSLGIFGASAAWAAETAPPAAKPKNWTPPKTKIQAQALSDEIMAHHPELLSVTFHGVPPGLDKVYTMFA